MKTLGSYLKKKREAAGLTQLDVADKLHHTTAQFISNIERDVSFPPDASIRPLAKLYGVPACSIIDRIAKVKMAKIEAWRNAI